MKSDKINNVFTLISSDVIISVMDKKITKSNAIINSSYRFSLNELRILLYGLSHINPRSDEFPMFHRVHIRELAEFYSIGEKDRGSFYDNIKDALLNKFWNREFSYYDEELGETVRRTWLTEIRYGRKDGTLAYEYNPKIKNQLQQLAKRFTSYVLVNIANMKSAYAVRLYEISVMYLNASKEKQTTFTKKIEDLKYHLDITDKYKNFFDMKKRVLEQSKKEINKHSDIKFSYKVKKLGRSPHEIEFTVSKKTNATPKQPALPEYKPTKLSPAVFEKAKQIAIEAGNRWDIYAIESQFYEYIKTKGQPDDIAKAFIGFVRKKVATPP